MAFPRRRLGQGLTVSALGLGCMGMSDFYGPSEDAANLRVLNHALDHGIDFLDTADMYGVGANEHLLSKVIRTRRDEVVFATSAAYRRSRTLTPLFQSDHDSWARLRDIGFDPRLRLPLARGQMSRVLTGTRRGWLSTVKLGPRFVDALETRQLPCDAVATARENGQWKSRERVSR